MCLSCQKQVSPKWGEMFPTGNYLCQTVNSSECEQCAENIANQAAIEQNRILGWEESKTFFAVSILGTMPRGQVWKNKLLNKITNNN